MPEHIIYYCCSVGSGREEEGGLKVFEILFESDAEVGVEGLTVKRISRSTYNDRRSAQHITSIIHSGGIYS